MFAPFSSLTRSHTHTKMDSKHGKSTDLLSFYFGKQLKLKNVDAKAVYEWIQSKYARSIQIWMQLIKKNVSEFRDLCLLIDLNDL